MHEERSGDAARLWQVRQRHVVVDDHLRTSDARIYAIGEIAEHRGTLYGITPVANEQAEVAAAHAAGELGAVD